MNQIDVVTDNLDDFVVYLDSKSHAFYWAVNIWKRNIESRSDYSNVQEELENMLSDLVERCSRMLAKLGSVHNYNGEGEPK